MTKLSVIVCMATMHSQPQICRGSQVDELILSNFPCMSRVLHAVQVKYHTPGTTPSTSMKPHIQESHTEHLNTPYPTPYLCVEKATTFLPTPGLTFDSVNAMLSLLLTTSSCRSSHFSAKERCWAGGTTYLRWGGHGLKWKLASHG